MDDDFKLQKRAGKAEFSGRRRTATRKSGFQSHEEATGGKFSKSEVSVYQITATESLSILFELPPHSGEVFAGFGFYFRANKPVEIKSSCKDFAKFELSEYSYPNWNKCGYIWRSEPELNFEIEISAPYDTEVELYKIECGEVWHDYFADSRENVIKNIHKFAPEALFFETKGKVTTSLIGEDKEEAIFIKECNRCARFLPVNFDNERNTLSFSNHCVARRPCKHKGFGILENLDTEQTIQLEFGFQLECRFCKKFVVNAALNPQRDANQMKEDAQRRRHFELLLSELYSHSKQLDFRHKTGKELATFIWNKFEKKCFKCKIELASARAMNLDHTRPLALLWALDETATALCKDCNSSKRDRYPSDFYNDEELSELAQITGIPLSELQKPSPNLEALYTLIDRREWFYSEFLNKDFLLREKGGKIPAELICKALDRVVQFCDEPINVPSFIDGWQNYTR